MQPVTLFSLETHVGPYADWPRYTRLFLNGVETRQTVPGYVIEAQYQCSDGYLLITSQDCIYEESNDFVLLNAKLETIARASIGLMYQTYLLEKHWPISDHALGLDYGGGEVYCLSIKKKLFGGRALKLNTYLDPHIDKSMAASLKQ
jgi:hypothetical protein